MNGLERVLATVAGKPHDRPAFMLNSGLTGARLTGVPLAQYFTDASAYADGQCAVMETFSPDLILSPFLFTALGEAFGSTAVIRGNNAPNIARPAAASIEEAIKLSWPDLDSHPRLLFLRGCVQELAKRLKGEVALVGVLASSVDLPVLIMGVEPWLDALLFDPWNAQALLERCAEFITGLANAMLKDGATIIGLSANFNSPTVVTEPVIQSLTRPSLEASFRNIQGPLVVHHGGCRLAPHLGSYLGLPNVVGWVVDARDSLAEARDALGPDSVLLGNLEGPALATKPPEFILAECQRILADRAGDPHFILATSQADIPYNTPLDHIAAIREALSGYRVVAS